MGKVAIKVENLSKLYRLGEIGTGTLSHDLNRWFARLRGKEDPFAKIGSVNDRTVLSDSSYVWALKDINFEVRQGDALGIVGKNGAGKSTLLKLLSRVTSPTTGAIKAKGRIASLLEVGTGFHPELTGRENVFLNGAILGMSKAEIRSKFDEIVSFAGVERYIDTPVKRYSSGMYVRLAFGVAAYLESEVLIIDEVLAVGDAEFQKKCLGKMSDVANKEGRTVLFVSHNMAAVQSLCNVGIALKNGMLIDSGPASKVVDNYLSREIQNCTEVTFTEKDAPGNEQVKLTAVRLAYASDVDLLSINTPFEVQVDFINYVDARMLNLSVFIWTASGVCVCNPVSEIKTLDKGNYSATLKIPAGLLNDDIYTVSIMFVKDASSSIFRMNDVLSFQLEEENREGNWFGKVPGVIRPKLEFKINSRSI